MPRVIRAIRFKASAYSLFQINKKCVHKNWFTYTSFYNIYNDIKDDMSTDKSSKMCCLECTTGYERCELRAQSTYLLN